MTLNSVKCFLNEMTGIQSYPTLTDKTILDCTQKAGFNKKKKLISQSEWQESQSEAGSTPLLCLKDTEECTARCLGGCPDIQGIVCPSPAAEICHSDSEYA